MTATRVLITGADGFVGRHLAAYLADEAGAEVLGLDLGGPRPGGPWERCAYGVCDILDTAAVFHVVEGFRPDYVFHLAAQSSVRRSWEDPDLTYRIALLGQSNLIDALLKAGVEARVHVACSAEEYGKVAEDELPVAEDHPLRPASPYALSKVMQEYHAIFCHQAYGIETVITRAFNMTGPGQSPEFVASDFARQIAEAEVGLREPVIRVGNLEARRDFSDVRDLVGAYWELLRKGEPGEAYNVCSGEDHAISELLDILLSLSDASIEVTVDPERYRVADIPVLRGDNARMRTVTGWEPKRRLEQTLGDLLDWWRDEIKRGPGGVATADGGSRGNGPSSNP
ncbi:MAG: GDP-mannose 4,6-dehydratase [Actinobacteria bacterium]|nr:GDP-mannose 4,6-dehydratase [Actinomycetota bacterium]